MQHLTSKINSPVVIQVRVRRRHETITQVHEIIVQQLLHLMPRQQKCHLTGIKVRMLNRDNKRIMQIEQQNQ